MPRPPSRHRLAAAAWLLVLLSQGCAPDEEPDGQDPRSAFRPGDSLLATLDRWRVERWPGSNLAPDVAALLADRSEGGLRLRTASLPAEAWTAGRPVTGPYAAPFAGRSDLRLFRSRASLPGTASGTAPSILQRGAPAPAWDGAPGTFPGEFLYWNAGTSELCAIAPQPPADVQLEVTVDPATELGVLELSLAHGAGGAAGAPGSPASAAPAAPAPPAAGNLRRRAELGRVSRPAVLLPAPGSFAIDAGPLQCDVLALSVGVLDHAWRASEGALERAFGRSDGATFAVDVEAGGRRERVWSAAIDAASVGRRFLDAEIDLARFAGQSVVLHLQTDPGPAGNADFDYAVWSDLRLLGAARARPAGEARAARPNVVLIDADTLRPDRLGCYGSRRPTSPRLDAWAAERGLRFADVRSTGCYTLPATATMLTGLAVHQHRLGQGAATLAGGGATLAARLAAAGWETLGIAEGAYLSTSFGFDQGFDVYVTRDSKQPGWELARDWMADRRRRSERPFFLFLQTYTVHAPYDHDPRFLDAAAPYAGPLAGAPIGIDTVINPVREGRLRLDAADLAYANALYDAGIARLDGLAADVIDAAHALVPDEELLVLFMADHGEEFLEHGSMAHNHTLYNELLSVPLVIDMPGAGTPGVSDAPASLLDVVPTVLDLLGLPADVTLPGRSLRQGPGSSPASSPGPDARPRVAQYAPETHSIEVGGLKLIRGRTFGVDAPVLQLFDLRADPGEHHDLSAAHPESVASLGRMLDEWLARWPAAARLPSPDAAIDARTLQDLEALGYAGDGH